MPDHPARLSFPRWLDRSESVNLRQVAVGLYVGAVDAPGFTSKWFGVVDLYGKRNWPAPRLLRLPFHDGDDTPHATLDAAWAVVQEARERPVLVCCAAGLSRSVSVAYALLRRRDGLSHETALKRVQHPKYAHVYPCARTLMSARAWVHRV